MNDDAQVAAGTNRPEIRVLGAFDAVETETGMSGIDLEVEDGRLHGLLLLRSEVGQAAGEGVGDAEVHECLLISSPRKRRLWFLHGDP